MTDNFFKTETNEQHLTSSASGQAKRPWHCPRLDVLKGSDTEHGSGSGLDGGGPASNFS